MSILQVGTGPERETSMLGDLSLSLSRSSRGNTLLVLLCEQNTSSRHSKSYPDHRVLVWSLEKSYFPVNQPRDHISTFDSNHRNSRRAKTSPAPTPKCQSNHSLHNNMNNTAKMTQQHFVWKHQDLSYILECGVLEEYAGDYLTLKFIYINFIHLPSHCAMLDICGSLWEFVTTQNGFNPVSDC